MCWDVFDFINEVSLGPISNITEKDHKFISYSLFVIKTVSQIMYNRVSFNEDKRKILLDLVLKFDKYMWESYNCCDSITQIWSFIYGFLDDPNLPWLGEIDVNALNYRVINNLKK